MSTAATSNLDRSDSIFEDPTLVMREEDRLQEAGRQLAADSRKVTVVVGGFIFGRGLRDGTPVVVGRDRSSQPQITVEDFNFLLEKCQKTSPLNRTFFDNKMGKYSVDANAQLDEQPVITISDANSLDEKRVFLTKAGVLQYQEKTSRWGWSIVSEQPSSEFQNLLNSLIRQFKREHVHSGADEKTSLLEVEDGKRSNPNTPSGPSLCRRVWTKFYYSSEKAGTWCEAAWKVIACMIMCILSFTVVVPAALFTYEYLYPTQRI